MPIDVAKTTFENSLHDIEVNTNFYSDALKLRRRSSKVFSFDRIDQVDKPTIERFSSSRVDNGDLAYEVLYVSICFHYERYIREICTGILIEIGRRHTKIEELKDALIKNHVAASGLVLSRYGIDPRAARVDVHRYAQNLLSCAPGSSAYELNSEAFIFFFSGSSTEQIHQLGRKIGWHINWDEIGRDTKLRHFFKGGGTRETANLTQKFVDDFVSKRNKIVHRGDGVPSISESDVHSTIQFFRIFAKAFASTAKHFCENYNKLAS